MQRFHAGACTNAVNNGATAGIQERDAFRADPSALPPNFSLNAGVEPPYFHPQTPNRPKETLTESMFQSGYRETVEGLKDSGEISLSQVLAFTKRIIVKCKEPLLWVAPVPPKEFQHSETDLETLTCGYSICLNNYRLHEVVLGTTGRKQGTSAKGAISPSTESFLCKKPLLELFILSSNIV